MSILSLLVANLFFGTLSAHAHQSPDAGITRGQTPMLIYFRSDDCATCTAFDALFEQADMLHRMEEQFMPVLISIDDSTGKACANIYKVTHIPAVVIADPAGTILYKSDASLSVEDITRLLESIPGSFADVPAASPKTGQLISAAQQEETREENAVKETDEDKPDRPLTASAEIPKAIPVNNARAETLASSSPTVTTEIDASNEKPVALPVAEITVSTPKPKGTATSKVNTHKSVSHTPRQYAIQLGYFSEEANAQKFVQKVIQKGLTETRTETEMRNGISYYRVLVGKCNSLTEAQKILAEVHNLGLKGAVHRQ